HPDVRGVRAHAHYQKLWQHHYGVRRGGVRGAAGGRGPGANVADAAGAGRAGPGRLRLAAAPLGGLKLSEDLCFAFSPSLRENELREETQRTQSNTGRISTEQSCLFVGDRLDSPDRAHRQPQTDDVSTIAASSRSGAAAAGNRITPDFRPAPFRCPSSLQEPA